MNDENQIAAERDDVNNEPSTNKSGDSRISQLIEFSSNGSFTTTRSDTKNLKSQGDSEHTFTLVLEHLRKQNHKFKLGHPCSEN